MNIFALAHKQTMYEGKLESKDYANMMIDRAIKIRHYLDIQERNIKVANNRIK